MRLRSVYLWILAFVLVAFAAVYQRMTGPTYPLRGSAIVSGNEISFRLLRSSDSAADAEVRVAVPDEKVTGSIELRRYKSRDAWTRTGLTRQGSDLVAQIPHQPPAGKVAYKIFLSSGSEEVALTAEPVILRFKGAVTSYVMYPHIILMFLAMLYSTRAGFEALLKRPKTYRLAFWTVVTLALGGMILGPIVQKFAFGAYWTGWPFGQDLTDNKTVVSFVIWLVALWRLRKNPSAAGWAVIASLVLFLVYMIPHSVLGSELDYTATPAK